LCFSRIVEKRGATVTIGEAAIERSSRAEAGQAIATLPRGHPNFEHDFVEVLTLPARFPRDAARPDSAQ